MRKRSKLTDQAVKKVAGKIAPGTIIREEGMVQEYCATTRIFQVPYETYVTE